MTLQDWTAQQPFVVTEGHIKLPWRGQNSKGLCCGFCMHAFESGEIARWVFVEGAPNTFVCTEHDGPDVAERWRVHWRTVIQPILARWA